jgi:AcrR family transcriptional regulator
VELVLRTTIEELGRVGYAGLRVEDVAARSGVNKTTVYRRWPTKSELVAAAFERLKPEEQVSDSGALRDDLFIMLREMVARAQTPLGRGIVRMIQVERADPEVAELIRQMRERGDVVRRRVFERAIERGEIPSDSDTALLTELVMGPLVARVVHRGVDADARFLRALIDTVVAGAKARTAVIEPT